MDIYNVIFYILIFIIGTLFGSFYTLAVYRIPKHEDITHKHSYCPKCNHKLGPLDLIPVFSYIFLKGKCRYCKKRIRPRYFIIEILSGLAFVALACFLKLDVYEPTAESLIQYGFMVLYITFLVLMLATEKESRKIEKSISVYGIVISLMYIVYLCIVEGANIYRYAIYLMFYILVLILDTVTLKKYAKNAYTDGILLTIITMAIFTGEAVTISTIIYVLLIISVYTLLKRIKRKSKKERKKIGKKKQNETLPIGFYLGVANALNLFIALAFTKLIL